MRVRIQVFAFAVLLAATAMPVLSRARDASKGIKVEITGLRNSKGQLGCSLWKGPRGISARRLSYNEARVGAD